MSDVNKTMIKAHFDEYHGALPDFFPPAEAVRNAVDSLLGFLYAPATDVAWRADGRKLKKFGLSKEPINWGDLSCTEVEKFADGSWFVVIEEAAPECPNLCEYVRAWLEKWGWNARVQTEW